VKFKTGLVFGVGAVFGILAPLPTSARGLESQILK
jgi:hypothetical protein